MAENPVTNRPNGKPGDIDLVTAIWLTICFIGGAVVLAVLLEAGPIRDIANRFSRYARRALAALPDFPSPNIQKPSSGENPEPGENPFDLGD